MMQLYIYISFYTYLLSVQSNHISISYCTSFAIPNFHSDFFAFFFFFCLSESDCLPLLQCLWTSYITGRFDCEQYKR